MRGQSRVPPLPTVGQKRERGGFFFRLGPPRADPMSRGTGQVAAGLADGLEPPKNTYLAAYFGIGYNRQTIELPALPASVVWSHATSLSYRRTHVSLMECDCGARCNGAVIGVQCLR